MFAGWLGVSFDGGVGGSRRAASFRMILVDLMLRDKYNAGQGVAS